MTDPVIEKIHTIAQRAVEGGQPFSRVHIFPFRMTAANLAQFADSLHRPFWDNLKNGYDLFEEAKVDPNVEVQGGRYVFDFNEPRIRTIGRYKAAFSYAARLWLTPFRRFG